MVSELDLLEDFAELLTKPVLLERLLLDAVLEDVVRKVVWSQPAVEARSVPHVVLPDTDLPLLVLPHVHTQTMSLALLELTVEHRAVSVDDAALTMLPVFLEPALVD